MSTLIMRITTHTIIMKNYNYDPNLSDEYYDDTQMSFMKKNLKNRNQRKEPSFLSALAILLAAGELDFDIQNL